MAPNNMYRVGDYVYIDAGANNPFGVRRIDELTKSANGNVEVRVMIYVRRCDLPPEILPDADDNLKEYWDKMSKKYPSQVHEREVFLTKQTETISATQIRGKCQVALLNKAETLFSYIKAEDTFFYSLVYDSTNRSLLEDRGEIKVGSAYQCEVPLTTIKPEEDTRVSSDLEDLCWSPSQSDLKDKQVDQFLFLARSVGTFARAVDEASTLKQPSLHMSAAAASRDITLFHAMDLLHNHNYDFAAASLALVENCSPRLSTDQMEEWTTAEAALFEEAMEKYGKGFNEIRADFLPWKTAKNLVEYYYMWKTTDRYVQQKRVKAVESEQKLKQVYVPEYAKLGEGAVPATAAAGAVCLCCRSAQSAVWYDMPGTELAGLPRCNICQTCWFAYRKYAALTPGGIDTSVKLPLGGKFGMSKGKKAITLTLASTLMARIARKLPKSPAINVKKVGRRPFRIVDQDAVRQECCRLVADNQPAKIQKLLSRHQRTKRRRTLLQVSARCGVKDDPASQEWLIPCQKDKLPQPETEAFPRVEPRAPEVTSQRAVDPPTPVGQNRIKMASIARVNARNGVEVKFAREDMFFKSNKAVVTARQGLPHRALKKMARKPCKRYKLL